MSQALAVLSNAGPGGSAGAGMTKAVYRYPFTFTKASTHTAQTLVPLGVVARAGTVKAVTCAWLEVNAANTTLATVQITKRSLGAAAAGTSLLSTAATLSNNQTAQNWQVVSTAFALTQNTGAAAVSPILSTTAATVALAAGDELCITTTATSTQGTDMTVTVEVEYNLADDSTPSGLI